jgi:hypothetical protein
MARHIKKPSEQWQGTIDLLLRLTGATIEADLLPIWDAWTNCNKKEAHTVLQEHLQDNAQTLGLPQPVATGKLTTMLDLLAFNSSPCTELYRMATSVLRAVLKELALPPRSSFIQRRNKQPQPEQRTMDLISHHSLSTALASVMEAL